MVRNLGFGRSWQKSRPVAMVEDEDGDGEEEKWIYILERCFGVMWVFFVGLLYIYGFGMGRVNGAHHNVLKSGKACV